MIPTVSANDRKCRFERCRWMVEMQIAIHVDIADGGNKHTVCPSPRTASFYAPVVDLHEWRCWSDCSPGSRRLDPVFMPLDARHALPSRNSQRYPRRRT